MEYTLLWNGRLWKVGSEQIKEVDEADRWLYVQKFVTSDGNHGEAMRTVLRTRYPGIGWSGFKESLVPFGASSSCESDMSSPASASHNHSHRPRPPSSGRPMKDAVSDTGVPRKPVPPRATSSASRPHGHPGKAVVHAKSPRTKMPAIHHTVGWMGSSSTTA